jgi:hypothetical protein
MHPDQYRFIIGTSLCILSFRRMWEWSVDMNLWNNCPKQWSRHDNTFDTEWPHLIWTATIVQSIKTVVPIFHSTWKRHHRIDRWIIVSFFLSPRWVSHRSLNVSAHSSLLFHSIRDRWWSIGVIQHTTMLASTQIKGSSSDQLVTVVGGYTTTTATRRLEHFDSCSS